jgi:hypothetical protein
MKVGLERPRRPEIVTSEAFVGQKKQILEAIRDESLRSFSAQAGETVPG